MTNNQGLTTHISRLVQTRRDVMSSRGLWVMGHWLLVISSPI